MKSKLITGLLIFAALTAWSQPYGNEWIKFNQQYFKIKLAEDGVYRINAAALQQAGVPVTTIAASRIKIFRRGQEIAVNKIATGGFLDYLEFYGEKKRWKTGLTSLR